ncbi:flagellar transcriptional regulator FlhD, partial [Escherichia coli]
MHTSELLKHIYDINLSYLLLAQRLIVQDKALMNPLMILVKIIKLRWIHILSYDQMVSRKINNQTTRCANSIF